MIGAMMTAGMRPRTSPSSRCTAKCSTTKRTTTSSAPDDLLLADVGAETPEGWAGDVTRVWPASGRFSPTQRALYEVVLASAARRHRHGAPRGALPRRPRAAARHMLDGLVALGIFRGDVEGSSSAARTRSSFRTASGTCSASTCTTWRTSATAPATQAGRTRPTRFGDRYLRLDRDLVPGMAVTIEPGFYQVPAILAIAQLTAPFDDDSTARARAVRRRARHPHRRRRARHQRRARSAQRSHPQRHARHRSRVRLSVNCVQCRIPRTTSFPAGDFQVDLEGAREARPERRAAAWMTRYSWAAWRALSGRRISRVPPVGCNRVRPLPSCRRSSGTRSDSRSH